MTLVEILLAVTLGGLLLTAVGSLVWGMSRLTERTTAQARVSRALEFSLDLLRKELQEVRRDPGNPEFDILAGDGVLSFVTSRLEVIARSEVPRGFQRVEWRFIPEEARLQRRVFRVAREDREAGETVTQVMLGGLVRVVLSRWGSGNWRPITGDPAPVTASGAFRLELEFRPDASPIPENWISTGFILPHG